MSSDVSIFDVLIRISDHTFVGTRRNWKKWAREKIELAREHVSDVATVDDSIHKTKSIILK